MKALILITTILWSHLAMGQSEPITSLQGQSQATKFTAPKLRVPYNQATKISGGVGLIETGSENMLANAGFEGVASTVPDGWTCTTGTCTKTTTSGEFSSGLAAMKIVPAANVLNVSQSVNTPAGIQAQGYARILYRVPSTCSTSFVIRTLVNGSTQSEVPTNRLIFDDKFHEIEIPLVFSTTSAGIQVFASGTCTGNIFIDGAVIAQGLGTQNLMLDNTFSFLVTTTTGSVSSENKDIISSCTAANPTVCTFNTGYFTVAPNCNPGSNGIAAAGFRVSAVSATSVSIESYNTTTGNPLATQSVAVFCQKSGNDYLNSSANVYSQASADYSGPVTFTGTWTTNTSYVFNMTRRQGRAFFEGRVRLTGAPNSASLNLTMPSGLVIDTARLTDSNIRSAYGITRVYDSSSGTAVNLGQVQGIDSTTVAIQAQISSSNTGLGNVTQAAPITFANDDSIYVKFDVPIVGWPDSATIIGSFAGVPAVPGYQGLVDTFSVSYAANSSFNSACTTGSCTIDQSGSAVSSVNWSGAGAYAMNFPITYLKMFCTGSTLGATYTNLGSVRCTNCNTISFFTGAGSTATNTYGTLSCIGIR